MPASADMLAAETHAPTKRAERCLAQADEPSRGALEPPQGGLWRPLRHSGRTVDIRDNFALRTLVGQSALLNMASPGRSPSKLCPSGRQFSWR